MKASVIITSAVLLCIQTTSIASATRINDQLQLSTVKPAAGFDFVRAHRQGKGVTLTWSFSSEGAIGFTVQRTYEDPADPYAAWEDATSIGYNAARSYKYNDISVFPGSIHYRVVAQYADGTSVVSETVTVKIVSKG
jgi:hypothetical protein